MRKLLLIQTGEAPDSIAARFGGFADWFRTAMRIEAQQMQIARVDAGAGLPQPDTIAGAVITGSAAMVTERADWSERTAAWVRTAMASETPMFGVCYGHQLMADALGGTVDWLPAGREIGTESITQVAGNGAHATAWPGVLPHTFPAHTTHRQSVLSPPADSAVLARSTRDPHQLLRYTAHALSTQFHPEFTAAHMRAYIAARADALREEGFDPDVLTAQAGDTEAARGLLERFAHTALANA